MFRIPFYLGALLVLGGANPNLSVEMRIGWIGLGVFLAISSRIWQAEIHFRKLGELLKDRRGDQTQSLIDDFAETQRQKKS